MVCRCLGSDVFIIFNDRGIYFFVVVFRIFIDKVYIEIWWNLLRG